MRDIRQENGPRKEFCEKVGPKKRAPARPPSHQSPTERIVRDIRQGTGPRREFCETFKESPIEGGRQRDQGFEPAQK